MRPQTQQTASRHGVLKWPQVQAAMRKLPPPNGIWRSLNLQRMVLRAGFKKPSASGKPWPAALLGKLRNSGALSPRDLEWVLLAVGAALPAGQLISNLDFQVQGNGETRLQGLQLSESQAKDFAQALRKQGLDAQTKDGKWRIVSLRVGL